MKGGERKSEIKTVSPPSTPGRSSVARLSVFSNERGILESGCLQDQLISSAFYYEYFRLSSAPCALHPPLPDRSPSTFPARPFGPPRRRFVLHGQELKHIRPALNFGSIANGGREVFVVLSPGAWMRVLVSSWRVPRIDGGFSLAEYHSVGASWREKLRSGTFTQINAIARRLDNIRNQASGVFPRKRKPITSPPKTSATARGYAFL